MPSGGRQEVEIGGRANDAYTSIAGIVDWMRSVAFYTTVSAIHQMRI